MKRLFLVIVSSILLGSSVSTHAADSEPSEFNYKKKGFFLGGELNGVLPLNSGLGIPVAGKLDFIVGYQFSPYFSLNADLWTVFFVVYGVELGPRVNFTKGKISPFATASIGVGGTPLNIVFEEEPDWGGIILPYYSAALGIDFRLWERGTLYAQTKYHGVFSAILVPAIQVGAGFRWVF